MCFTGGRSRRAKKIGMFKVGVKICRAVKGSRPRRRPLTIVSGPMLAENVTIVGELSGGHFVHGPL